MHFQKIQAVILALAKMKQQAGLTWSLTAIRYPIAVSKHP